MLRGLIFVFREIHKAVEAELSYDKESITRSLQELYMLLETKKITEEEFEEQEAVLLDRLEAIDQQEASPEEEDKEDDEDEEELEELE